MRFFGGFCAGKKNIVIGSKIKDVRVGSIRLGYGSFWYRYQFGTVSLGES